MAVKASTTCPTFSDKSEGEETTKVEEILREEKKRRRMHKRYWQYGSQKGKSEQPKLIKMICGIDGTIPQAGGRDRREEIALLLVYAGLLSQQAELTAGGGGDAC